MRNVVSFHVVSIHFETEPHVNTHLGLHVCFHCGPFAAKQNIRRGKAQLEIDATTTLVHSTVQLTPFDLPKIS